MIIIIYKPFLIVVIVYKKVLLRRKIKSKHVKLYFIIIHMQDQARD